MENFVVSARKYRPITFESVVGQSHITTTLKNAIRTSHLAQAFLFCGPRGVGKTTCARILAKTINCQRLDNTAEPCGHCDSCEAFQHNASFNVHELDAASNNSVEDIRNLIDQVRYPPQAGSKKKVYIIDEVHMLSTSAFNAFLKTLEEPPSYAIFILATTEKHKILPTILSRCQIFDFNRIQNRDIAEHLAYIAQKEGIRAEYEALELIAQKADGGLRDALSMFDLNVTFSKDNTLHYAEVLANLHILDYDYYFKMTDALMAGSIFQSYYLLDDILGKGFDGHQFLVGLLEHLRNLMVCKDPQTIRLLQVSERVQQQYMQQSQEASLSFLLSALSVGSQCDIHYKQAKNQRLHLEICLSKLAKINEVFNVASLPESKGDEKKNDKPVRSEEEKLTSEEQPVKIEEKKVMGEEKRERTEVVPTLPKASKLRSTNNLVVAETPKAIVAEPSETFKQQKPFTPQELKQAWRAFSVQRQDPNEQVILDREYELQGSLIHLKLDNVVQQEILRNFQPDLMQYLRHTLQNSAIQMKVEISVQETAFRPYTQQEKFNYLAEKNPALIQLKQALGLDLDY